MKLFKRKKEIRERVSIEGIRRGGEKHALFLGERVFRVEINLSQIQKYWKEHRLKSALISCGILFFIFIGFRLFSHADVAVFYPSSCLGGWYHPEQAQGAPDVLDGPEENYTFTNSAVLVNNISQIFCGSFMGQIPEHAAPTKATLKFSWVTKTAGGIVLPNEETTTTATSSIEVVPNSEVSTSSLPETIPPTEETTSSPATSEPVSFLRFLIKKAFAEDTPPEGIQIIEIPVSETQVSTPPTEQTDPTPPESTSSQPEGQPTQPENQEEAQQSGGENPPAENEEPTQGGGGTSLSESATSSEEISSSSPENSSTTESTNATSESTGNEKTSDVVTYEQTPDSFLEILWSFDGTNWTSAGFVNPKNYRNASFEIPLTSWEEVQELQVQIKSLPVADAQPAIFLDGIILETPYEPAWQGTEISSSTISEGVIALLAQNDLLREELWIKRIYKDGEITKESFTKIAAEGEIQPNSPIGIIDGVICWFSGDGVALSCFDTRNNSPFSQSFEQVNENFMNINGIRYHITIMGKNINFEPREEMKEQ